MNYYELAYQRYDGLNNLVEILKSNNLALESADLLDEVYDELNGEVDISLLQEIAYGDTPALEAVTDNLDKAKIALVVALLAFIFRYISSVVKSGGYSFGGGGGGGAAWGGSAPPKFTSNNTPGTQEFQNDISEYEQSLINDLKVNIDRFKQALEGLENSNSSNNGFLNSMVGDKAYIHLTENIIKRVVKENMTQDINIFSKNPNNIPKDVIEFTKDNNSGKLANKVIPILKQLENSYTPFGVFVNGVQDKTILPPFILNEEYSKAAVEFLNFTKVLIPETPNFSSGIGSLISTIKSAKPLDQKADDILKFLDTHILESVLNSSKIGGPLNGIGKIDLDGTNKEGVKTIESSQIKDGSKYLNVGELTRHVKVLVKTLTSFDVASDTGDKASMEVNKQKTTAYIKSILDGKKLDIPNPIEVSKLSDFVSTINDVLVDNESALKTVSSNSEELIKYKYSITDISKGVDENESNYPEAAKLRSFKSSINLVEQLVLSFVYSVGGATAISKAFATVDENRLKLISSKLEAMNKDYYDLTNAILNVTKKSISGGVTS